MAALFKGIGLAKAWEDVPGNKCEGGMEPCEDRGVCLQGQAFSAGLQ